MLARAPWRMLLAATVAPWIAAPALGAPEAPRNFEVTVEAAPDAPVALDAAAVRVRPRRTGLVSGATEVVREVTLRNRSARKVRRVDVRWSALDATGARLSEEVVSYLPEKPLRRGRAFDQVAPAAHPGRDIHGFSATVVAVVFADRTVWTTSSGEAAIRAMAERGDPRAWYAYGLMYRDGREVPQDRVRAYTWLHLAATAGFRDAELERDRLAAELTPGELDEAERLARDWALLFFQESLD